MTTATIPDTLSAAYRMADTTRGEATPHEITEAAYWEGLECLPPIYAPGRFWVGEPSYGDTIGREIYLEMWEEKGKYYCRYSPPKASKPDHKPMLWATMNTPTERGLQ